ncbi:organic cation/carnitine transporter 4 [Cocos nucifera]|nr:organic cation/carnitine transporter 4 [Cocos nucifera]
MPAGPDDLASSGPSTALLSPSLPSDSHHDEAMGIDQMLQSFAGEFGAWQLRHFTFVSLAWALNAFHTMVVVFADREPDRRCVGPAGCCAEPGSWEWTSGPGASTVAEWGLVCGEKYKIGVAQSAFFVGSMIGAGIFGHLSDSSLGRKGTLTVTTALNAVFGLLTALSPSFWSYAALRFLTGLATGGLGLSAFSLATEPVGPSMRAPVAMSTFYFFSLGTVLLALMAASFSNSWRTLYTISSLPSFLFLVAVLPFVSESPRWYLVHHNIPRAMEVMRTIAKTNGNQLPDNISLLLDSDVSQKTLPTSNIVDVIHSPITRMRLILTVAINFLSSIVYYGLSLNVGNLSTELYVSVILNAIAEVPAYALTAMCLKCSGRRPLTIGTMWLSGVFCAVGSLLPDIRVWRAVRTLCSVVGIFSMAATFDLLFIYTAELFPTAVRSAALGCVTQAGQTGAIAAPLVVVLGGNWPFGVFGVCGVVGGVLGFYLPETLNRPFYDTMAGLVSGEMGKGAEDGYGYFVS